MKICPGIAYFAGGSTRRATPFARPTAVSMVALRNNLIDPSRVQDLVHHWLLGTVHGGWFETLLDSAVGCAVHSTLPAGKVYTTLEIKVNVVRPLTDAVPLVRAEGKVIYTGRQVGTAEGRILGPDGKLYAHATTTCLIFDYPSSTPGRTGGSA